MSSTAHAWAYWPGIPRSRRWRLEIPPVVFMSQSCTGYLLLPDPAKFRAGGPWSSRCTVRVATRRVEIELRNLAVRAVIGVAITAISRRQREGGTGAPYNDASCGVQDAPVLLRRTAWTSRGSSTIWYAQGCGSGAYRAHLLKGGHRNAILPGAAYPRETPPCKSACRVSSGRSRNGQWRRVSRRFAKRSMPASGRRHGQREFVRRSTRALPESTGGLTAGMLVGHRAAEVLVINGDSQTRRLREWLSVRRKLLRRRARATSAGHRSGEHAASREPREPTRHRLAFRAVAEALRGCPHYFRNSRRHRLRQRHGFAFRCELSRLRVHAEYPHYRLLVAHDEPLSRVERKVARHLAA